MTTSTINPVSTLKTLFQIMGSYIYCTGWKTQIWIIAEVTEVQENEYNR